MRLKLAVGYAAGNLPAAEEGLSEPKNVFTVFFFPAVSADQTTAEEPRLTTAETSLQRPGL